ncbi:MAG: VPLPA-CTERM sorting domain-containing protein [Gammaproteobacteria bacterium]
MNLKKMVIAVALAASMSAANAVNVALTYTGSNAIDDDGAILATVGDILTFDLTLDFSYRITTGGGFDINWDAAAIAFDNYQSAGLGSTFFGRDPVLEDGRLFNGAVGDFNGLTTGTIATVSFQVIGLTGSSNTSIAPSGTEGDSGPWIDGKFGDVIIENVDYLGAEVRVVPVPAAAWLMLSGVGALFGFRRSYKRCATSGVV